MIWSVHFWVSLLVACYKVSFPGVPDGLEWSSSRTWSPCGAISQQPSDAQECLGWKWKLLVVHLNSFMILIEPNCPLIGLIPSAFGWKSLSREYGYGCLQGFVPGISRKHLGGQSTHVGVPVLRPGVPDCYKPMIFKNGVRKAFPRPTKKVKAPTGSSRWARIEEDNRA